MTNPYWKTLIVFSLLVGTYFLFTVISNKDIKILIGIGGFLLMSFTFYQKEKNNR